MRKTNLITASAFLIITSALFSCAKSDKNDLKEAQLCLNSSAPADARSCITKIASINTAQANKLRCAAVFISEGFNTPASFTTALDQINGGTTGCAGGCSSTVNVINSFNFHNGDVTDPAVRTRNADVSVEAFNYCSQSETNIYTQISSMFRLGTLAANLAYAANGAATPTADQIKAQLTNLDAAEVGNIVITTYNTSCQNTANASDSTKKYCAELETAVNSGATATAIGNCLKGKLADPNYVCP
jgi:hypothetical protein